MRAGPPPPHLVEYRGDVPLKRDRRPDVVVQLLGVYVDLDHFHVATEAWLSACKKSGAIKALTAVALCF